MGAQQEVGHRASLAMRRHEHPHVRRGGTTTGPLTGQQRRAAFVGGERLRAGTGPAAAGCHRPRGWPERTVTHTSSMRRARGQRRRHRYRSRRTLVPPRSGRRRAAPSAGWAAGRGGDARRTQPTAGSLRDRICGANVLQGRGFDPSPEAVGGTRLKVSRVSRQLLDVDGPATRMRGGRDERQAEQRTAAGVPRRRGGRIPPGRCTRCGGRLASPPGRATGSSSSTPLSTCRRRPQRRWAGRVGTGHGNWPPPAAS